MLKKALKIIGPFVVESIIGLIIAALVFGIQAEIGAIIPVFLGICAGLIAALYFAEEKDK